MMHKSFFHLVISLVFLSASAAWAETEVLEGDKAKSLKETHNTAQTLSQKDKVFLLKKPSGETAEMQPKEITVEAGDYLFINNDEENTVHNVYDMSDQSWVLKKQLPGSMAAIKFTEPKEHKLRCAIHPNMQTTVNVVAKGGAKTGTQKPKE
jgi:plastocyanin